MFGFSPSIFPLTSESFADFLQEHRADLGSVEYIHSDALGKAIQAGKCRIQVLETNALWHGVTYQEDLPAVQEAIGNLIAKGVYPSPLW